MKVGDLARYMSRIILITSIDKEWVHGIELGESYVAKYKHHVVRPLENQVKICDLVKPNYETNIMGIVVSEVNNLIGDPEDLAAQVGCQGQMAQLVPVDQTKEVLATLEVISSANS